jgi:hypothetical protein
MTEVAKKQQSRKPQKNRRKAVDNDEYDLYDSSHELSLVNEFKSQYGSNKSYFSFDSSESFID